jgi:hypothetical protein
MSRARMGISIVDDGRKEPFRVTVRLLRKLSIPLG